jgi:F0F1-type ATP synthase assembly protein I
MKRSVDSDNTPHEKLSEPSLSSLKQLRVGQALLATTWRIVVPVLLGTGLGIFLDLRIGTKPWLTLLGVALGFVLAGKLIARLIKETEFE